MERTLILIKPDAMQRGLAFEILHRFERRGLRLAALRLVQADEAIASTPSIEHVVAHVPPTSTTLARVYTLVTVAPTTIDVIEFDFT